MNLSLLRNMKNLEIIKYIASNDNFIIYSSEINNRYFLKSICLANGENRTLFSSSEIIRIISFLDNKMKFIFEKKHNELSNIFMYSDGELTNLTPYNKAYFLKLDKVKNILYFESNERDQRFMDIYKVNLFTKKIEIHFHNENGDIISCLSEDGQSIIVRKINSIKKENNLVLIRIKDNSFEELRIKNGGSPQFFDKEGGHIYTISTYNHEFQYLQKVCLKTFELKRIYKCKWDIIFSFLSKSNKYLIYIINENGNYKLNIYDNFNNKLLDTSNLPVGTVKSLSLSQNEVLLSILIERPNSPGDIYCFNLENLAIVKITNVTNKLVDENIFTEGKPFVYKKNENISIYGQLYIPECEDSKRPLIILVHGGPGGQSTLNFDILTQFLCSIGYAIFAINHRGSSGYGKNYLNSIDGKHGIEDLKDCIDIKHGLKNHPNIDISKVGIIGISYGAFLSLSALTVYPEQFKFSICLFGVYNWLHTLKNLPASWENYKNIFYKKIGNPFEDEEHLKRISPYYNLENITKPVLFVSGGKDIRNNKEDLDYIVSTLNEKNLVKHLHYENEGHGLNDLENTIESYCTMSKFIKESLE